MTAGYSICSRHSRRSGRLSCRARAQTAPPLRSCCGPQCPIPSSHGNMICPRLRTLWAIFAQTASLRSALVSLQVILQKKWQREWADGTHISLRWRKWEHGSDTAVQRMKGFISRSASFLPKLLMRWGAARQRTAQQGSLCSPRLQQRRCLSFGIVPGCMYVLRVANAPAAARSCA